MTQLGPERKFSKGSFTRTNRYCTCHFLLLLRIKGRNQAFCCCKKLPPRAHIPSRSGCSIAPGPVVGSFVILHCRSLQLASLSSGLFVIWRFLTSCQRGIEPSQICLSLERVSRSTARRPARSIAKCEERVFVLWAARFLSR